MWRLYIPLHPSFIRGESHQNVPTLQHSSSEREPPTHVLRPRYSFPTIWILISSLLQVAFHSNHLSTKSKSVRESWCWGDYHLKHKSKEFIINTLSITFWRVVSPRLVRCRLGASDMMWSWTKKFVRARRSPTSWKSTRVRQVLRWWWPWWARQGCFFVDPWWVEPSMDSRNTYPSWVEVFINMDVR